MNNSLVHQTVKMMKKLGVSMTEKEAYQELLANNFIKPNGEPTEWAMQNGLVGVQYQYPEGMPDKNEDAEDPDFQAVLKRMKPSDFKPNEKGDDYYINAHSLVHAIRSALNENAISQKGIPRYKQVLNDLESQLD